MFRGMTIVFIFALALLFSACVVEPPPPAAATPPGSALTTPPGSPPDVQATVDASVQATIEAQGTGTTPTATPAAPTQTPEPTSEPTPQPTPTPTPVSQDSDGDGLSDAEELAIGTNPRVADTDGDGFLDKEEVENWDRNGGNHLRFNPLVADVPRLRVEALGSPVIQLLATTEAGVQITKGMTSGSTSEVKVTTSRGRTNVNEIERQHAVNVNAEVSQYGPITGGKIGVSYTYQHTDTTTQTTRWDQTTVATNRQASSEYYEAINSEAVKTTGGEIKILMGLLNDGDVSYTVNNMELAAYIEDPRHPGDLIAVGTLRHDGPLSFTPDPLGRTVDPKPAQFTKFNFKYEAKGNPEEISRILENSDKLVLQPTNLSLSGTRSDVDLNLAAQNIRARTAEVIIDFGDHQGLETERYRVAIDTGNGDELPFEELMSKHLNFDYTFSNESFPTIGASHTGLSSLRSLAMNSSTKSYWLVAHTFTPSQATTETTLYNILNQDYAAADIRLHKGDILHLVYITDTDLDGLSDRFEQLNGTQINVADSDGDGLDDALETYGWLSNLTGPPCDVGNRLTLVVSDPLKSDTDSDGKDDSQEFAECTNPFGDLKVAVRHDAGSDRLVNTGETLTLVARPANYLDSSLLQYEWKQTSGIPVGPLPNTPRIIIEAPDEVTDLAFQVSVTDPEQNNQAATDHVSLLVVRDDAAAVFVDLDRGDDFDNTGRSPESPLATIERALSTRFGGADVYLSMPDSGNPYTLNQTIELTSRTSLFGGFDKDWVRDPLSGTPPNPPTPIVVNRARAIDVRDFSTIWISRISVTANAPTDGEEHSYAIYARNGAKLILDRVNAKGSDLTTDYVINSVDGDPFESASSHGVFAFNLDELKITESKIQAGNGLDGPRGAHGADSDPGIKGTKGVVNGGGAGGAGTDNGANGGKGGAGATNVATCAGGTAGRRGGGSGGAGGSGASGSGFSLVQ